MANGLGARTFSLTIHTCIIFVHSVLLAALLDQARLQHLISIETWEHVAILTATRRLFLCFFLEVELVFREP